MRRASRSRLSFAALLLSGAASVVVPSPTLAQSTSASASASQPSDMPVARSGNPGFLLGAPRGYIGVRGNWLFVSAGSDVFDFITTQLTLDKRDFDTRTFGPELGIVVQ